MVISVGIDVSKDKHDCFIVSSEGEVLADVFTIPNNMDGFRCLLQKIQACAAPQDKIKVGLEATGHYSYNLLGFLLDNGLTTYVLNPLRTNFDKVKERAKLKSSVSRLVCILFPELEKLVPSVHIASVYALLEEFPGAKQVASAHLARLKALLETASKGRYKREMALAIRDAARNSIGSRMPAKSLELQHTIRLIRELDAEIAEIEEQIQAIMDELDSPITTIPGLGFRMAAMILAEVGDFSRFDSPDKLLAYAGMSPSTYQSGQLKNCYPHMEKRGSRYLRYALYNATKYVCLWDSNFAAYLAKKRAEGKHYYVAISHAAKKLVRLIFAMEKSGTPYHSSV